MVVVVRQLGDHRYAGSFREIESDENNYRGHAAVLKKEFVKHTGELRIKLPDAHRLPRYVISFWITAMNNPILIQATGRFVKEKT